MRSPVSLGLWAARWIGSAAGATVRTAGRVRHLCPVGVLGLFLLLAAGPAPAAWPGWSHCPTPAAADVAGIDAQLQLSAWVQQELADAAAPVAVISRSGLNLEAIGHRYSHAGFVRAAKPRETDAGKETGTSAPWVVRQLYFDCETGAPRIFDEGLPGFVRGVAPDTMPRLSVVWWPTPAAPPLLKAVEDDARSRALLSPVYQAQAHAWSLASQNCNQWLLEMLAAAFGGAEDRASAQQWLRSQAYEPSTVRLPWVGWLWAAAVLPHMGLAHHPDSDLRALRLEVTLPAAIEAFVSRLWPHARRTEFCLRGAEVVVRRGWQPLDEPCTAREGDEVRPLWR